MYVAVISCIEKQSLISPYVGTIEYQVKRVDGHQELVRARRDIAYKRQESISRSLPETLPDLQAEDASAASTSPVEAEVEVDEADEADEAEGHVVAEGKLIA